MTRNSKRWLALLLVLVVVLAGCAGSGSNNSMKGGADHANNGASANSGHGGNSNSKSNNDAGSAPKSALVVQQRMLIRNGDVTLSVQTFGKTSQTLTQLASQRGGFVSDSSQRVHHDGNRTWVSGKIVFRIPKGNFSAFFERAKRMGDVEHSNTETTDVTDQLVDLQARLKNLRSQRDKLRSLYKQANDTDSVLSVQKRLSDVQSNIERLEAKQKSLKGQVAYSTVTVTMNESKPTDDVAVAHEKSWYDTGVTAAFLNSVDGVVVMLRAFTVGAAYVLPYLVVLAIPLGVLAVFWRRR